MLLFMSFFICCTGLMYGWLNDKRFGSSLNLWRKKNSTVERKKKGDGGRINFFGSR